MILEETLNNKLIISDIYGYTLGFQLEDERVVRIYDFSNESVVGNIYCGYVKDVVKNINAAFVEFDSDKKGFYLLKNNISVKQGDKVIVQVSGDKIKSKDYTLTSNININSECLVLTVGNTDISISKKINDTSQRERLKNVLEKYRNDDYGFILRTSSVNFSDEEIIKQADELITQWEEIKRRFEHASPKSILLRKDYLIDKVNEFISKTDGEIITDNINACLMNICWQGLLCLYHSI